MYILICSTTATRIEFLSNAVYMSPTVGCGSHGTSKCALLDINTGNILNNHLNAGRTAVITVGLLIQRDGEPIAGVAVWNDSVVHEFINLSIYGIYFCLALRVIKVGSMRRNVGGKNA